MNLLKLLPYIIILLLLATIFSYRGKWIGAKSELKNIDSFNFSIHTSTDQLETGITDPILLKAINTVDSIHFQIIEKSGGLNEEDASSMNFDNYQYPDLVLMNYGYKRILIENLRAVRDSRTDKREIRHLNNLIEHDWGKNSEDNSVTQISSRLMMTKIALISMNNEK